MQLSWRVVECHLASFPALERPLSIRQLPRNLAIRGLARGNAAHHPLFLPLRNSSDHSRSHLLNRGI